MASTDSLFAIADCKFTSRLMLGTGRYRSIQDMESVLAASETQIVTIALRRLDLDDPAAKNILASLNKHVKQILPNTAGCTTAEEAVFSAKLGRELFSTSFVKLEVIPDGDYLLPDPVGTLEAARILVADGFTVLPYINADPVLAKRLEEEGCATVMPLGSPIGSGQGVVTAESLAIIIEQARIPVVVDAGLGVPSDAAMVMEMGASAVLVNTAIAQAKRPATMAEAFKRGVEAGRMAYLAGRMPISKIARASSPKHGLASA